MLVSARLFEGLGQSIFELLQFDRGEVIDRTVDAFGVKPLHPVRGRGLDLIDVSPGPFVMDQLGLIESDLGLREGVVVGVADGSNRGVDAFLDQAVGEGNGRIDAAGIGVMRQSGEVGDAEPVKLFV